MIKAEYVVKENVCVKRVFDCVSTLEVSIYCRI